MGKKACIETFGCQMNVHDSERMSGLLEQAGYELTHDVEDADLVVVNTCSVREKAEDKLFARLDALGGRSDLRPLVAVTGCVAQQEGSRLLERSARVDVVVGTQALRRLPLLVNEAAETGRRQVDVNPYDDVSFPLGIAARRDPVKAYVTIIEGCNDYCSFCVVPYTRGHERMRPARDILAEVRDAAARGHREIHLLGQIVNHYHDPDRPEHDFAWLLQQVHAVDGVERIRFASPHPRHVTARLIEAMRDLPKVCKHLHLPVQSGSSRVLERMRRRYSRDTYLQLVAEIREAIPNIALSTDMIVGFPRRGSGRLREHVVADRDRPVSRHVLVQVLAAPAHAGRQAHARHGPRRGEDGASHEAAGAAEGHSGRAQCRAGRRRGGCPRRRPQPPAAPGPVRPNHSEHGRQLSRQERLDWQDSHRARRPRRTAQPARHGTLRRVTEDLENWDADRDDD